MRLQLKGFFEKESIGIKFIIIVGILVFFAVLFLFISDALLSLLAITDEVQTLKFTQLVSGIGLFICGSFALAYLLSQNIRSFLSFRKTQVIVLVLAMLSVFVVIPFINFLAELNNQITFPEAFRALEETLRAYEDKLAGLTESLLLSDRSLSGLFLNLLIIAAVPALGEELLFRGVIQNSLARSLNNEVWAVWITAFLFSAIHFQFYGFIPRMLLGAYFGYLLIWSRSIWVPVAAHFMNNATIVVFYYFMKKDPATFDIETVGTDGALSWAIGSIVLFSVLAVALRKRTIDNQCVNSHS